VPAGAAWLHEPKLDGYRLQIVTQGGQARLYSRNGHEWTGRLPYLAKALQGLPSRSAVIDAELVLPDSDGRPDFRALHRGLSSAGGADLAVYVFDLLHRDGADLRPLPLVERKRRLARLVARAEIPCMHVVEWFGDGAHLLKRCESLGFEGIVSKRRDAPYRSGECRDWRKIKTAAWREANRERWRQFEGGSR